MTKINLVKLHAVDGESLLTLEFANVAKNPIGLRLISFGYLFLDFVGFFYVAFVKFEMLVQHLFSDAWKVFGKFIFFRDKFFTH